SRFWRYPEAQSTAIRYHHYPSRSGNNRLAYIVHLADFAAKEAGFKSGETAPSFEIDPHILEYLGFENVQLEPIIDEISTSVEKLATEFQ
ncbi:MAG: hypothetical protein PVI55_21280, partial [Desulfobacterales bacterium]